MAMDLKKDLQDVNKALNVLSKKVEKMIAATDEKPEPTTKAKPAKNADAKNAAPKKTEKLSAAETVLGFIKKSKNGINIEKLKEKTGFQGQKLHNAVYQLKKQGRIKSEKKGLYGTA